MRLGLQSRVQLGVVLRIPPPLPDGLDGDGALANETRLALRHDVDEDVRAGRVAVLGEGIADFEAVQDGDGVKLGQTERLEGPAGAHEQKSHRSRSQFAFQLFRSPPPAHDGP